ncbi:MAG: penicillin acylase family protein [Propionibacteriales bacterium]|nr:penicillin acylase family protein [Propionibacteriales bacterium]
MSRLRRTASIVAIVLVAVLVLALVAATWAVRRSFPQTEGEITVPGLESEVTVYRDERGVPQIYADNSEDLFYAQGFVHAQDRFFEMDFRRHVTAGRTAELFGEEAVETDSFVRTLGWREVAEREIAMLDADTRRYLEAYADGVNAYIGDRGPSQLSLEYVVLGLGGLDYSPEEWTPVDSLAWLKAMAWDLRSDMEDEIDRVLATQTLEPEQVARLYPDYPFGRHPPIVTSGAVVDGVFEQEATQNTTRQPRRAVLSPAVVSALRGVAAVSNRLPSLLGTGSGLGSNAWAVSGERTSTGLPLLANDPHLAPSIPGIWYQMGLHCTTVDADCPFDVSGFTFSGLPGVVIGHNDTIAWGFTNLGADVADLYVEDVRGDSYRYKGRFRPVRQRRERIRVAGGEDVRITVRSTRHGPLISDVNDELSDVAELGEDVATERVSGGRRGLRGDAAIALRWTALEPGRTADALFMMNTARSWDEFRRAARYFDVPAQNLVYADVDGRIGYQAPGRIPIRRSGNGDWPVPGWDPAYEWADQPVPFDALPNVLDPPEGYVVTANQAVIGKDYPYYLGSAFARGYRSQRIAELIRDDLSLTPEDMTQIQLDAQNGNAETLVPYLLDLNIDAAYVREGQQVLEDWDMNQSSGSAGAAFFNVVWTNVLEKTFHDQLPEEVWPDGGDRWFDVVRKLLNRPHAQWWDDARTGFVETRDDILIEAMQEARHEITRLQARDPELWSWGHLHRLELVHQSLGRSGIGPIEWLFNRGPFGVGGGDSMVNATGWDATEGYDVNWVPSMRMVVSLDDLDESHWINLTGASGHVFNARYSDQSELWREGETTPWAFSPEAVRETAVDELRLVPAG